MKAPDPVKGCCANCGVTIWIARDGQQGKYLCDSCYRRNQDEINRTQREQREPVYPGLKKGW